MKCAPFVAPLLLFASVAAHAAPRYRIIAIKPPPGCKASYATCLNDRGQVAGELVLRGQHSWGRRKGACAFLWTRGHMVALPSLPSPYMPGDVYDAEAAGINDHGHVVGTLSYSFDGAWMGTDLKGVVWDRRGLHVLPKLNGMNQCTAIAINDKGQVAGKADDDYITDSYGSPAPHVYFYDGTHGVDLGPGCATGLSADGTVTGYVPLNANRQPTAATTTWTTSRRHRRSSAVCIGRVVCWESASLLASTKATT